MEKPCFHSTFIVLLWFWWCLLLSVCFCVRSVVLWVFFLMFFATRLIQKFFLIAKQGNLFSFFSKVMSCDLLFYVILSLWLQVFQTIDFQFSFKKQRIDCASHVLYSITYKYDIYIWNSLCVVTLYNKTSKTESLSQKIFILIIVIMDKSGYYIFFSNKSYRSMLKNF